MQVDQEEDDSLEELLDVSLSDPMELEHQTSKAGTNRDKKPSSFFSNSSILADKSDIQMENKQTNLTVLVATEKASFPMNLSSSSRSIARQNSLTSLANTKQNQDSEISRSVSLERKGTSAGPSSSKPIDTMRTSQILPKTPDAVSMANRISRPNRYKMGNGSTRRAMSGENKRKSIAPKNSMFPTQKSSFVTDIPKEATEENEINAVSHTENADEMSSMDVEVPEKAKESNENGAPTRPPCSLMTITNAAKASSCQIKLEKCEKKITSDKVQMSHLFLEYCMEADNANCEVSISLHEYRDSFSGTLQATSTPTKKPGGNE